MFPVNWSILLFNYFPFRWLASTCSITVQRSLFECTLWWFPLNTQTISRWIVCARRSWTGWSWKSSPNITSTTRRYTTSTPVEGSSLEDPRWGTFLTNLLLAQGPIRLVQLLTISSIQVQLIRELSASELIHFLFSCKSYQLYHYKNIDSYLPNSNSTLMSWAYDLFFYHIN